MVHNGGWRRPLRRAGFLSGVTVLVIFGARTARAVTKTFIGTSGADWFTGTNWSPSGVPAPTDDVVVNANGPGLTADDRFMVPSTQLLGTGGAPALTNATLDHFKCYKATVAKAPSNQPPYPTFAPVTVTVTDEFGGPLQYDLKKPKHFCVPADKNGEDPTAPAHAVHLLCYQAKLTTPQPKFVKTIVSTNNQFGPEVIKATAVDELCVPAVRLD